MDDFPDDLLTQMAFNIEDDFMREMDQEKNASVREDLEEGINRFIEQQKNTETAKKTARDVAKVTSYLMKSGEGRDLHLIPPAELDIYLADYFLKCRKPDGEEYEPGSISCIYSSVKRYLEEKKYTANLTTDPAFATLRRAIASKKKQLKKDGKGNRPNRVSIYFLKY